MSEVDETIRGAIKVLDERIRVLDGVNQYRESIANVLLMPESERAEAYSDLVLSMVTRARVQTPKPGHGINPSHRLPGAVGADLAYPSREIGLGQVISTSPIGDRHPSRTPLSS